MTMLRPQHISGERNNPGGAFALGAYRAGWGLLAPLAPLILSERARRGKEDTARMPERFGHASRKRPDGSLIWIHGASVGESVSILPLTSALLDKPNRSILVTTGTVTSAKLMAARLPERAFHQYVPIDSPAAVEHFLDHWRPDLALFVESELWPNLILATRRRAVPMALVNARLSEGSYRGWLRAKGLARRLMQAFDVALAQDEVIAVRLRALGAPNVIVSGSLKADAPPLPADETALAQLMNAIYPRSVFLAASTHPGEDEAILDATAALQQCGAHSLTVIVPRQPARGGAIAEMAQARGFKSSCRATGALPDSDTQVYVADTMGELGVFYRAARFAFVGGSLVPHGGHNPLEPAVLDTAVIAGPHVQNFAEIYRTIFGAQGTGLVRSAAELTALVLTLTANPIQSARLAGLAKAAAQSLSGALSRTVDSAERLLASYART
jgi:3-deoxy-D-manno-octulosonic-acid transferase